MKKPRTLFEKVWDSHIVVEEPNSPAILYIDLHLIHEVTSPQAFSSLREAVLKVRRPERTLGTMDHSTPTNGTLFHSLDQQAKAQLEELKKNCEEFGIQLFELGSPKNGIVHVIAPELGLIQPGITVVCGDSHTSTHGAFGSLAFGIGTSEVEHVLATQTLQQNIAKTLLINIDGQLGEGITPKDIILYIIGQIGTAGATGYVVEYAGSAIRELTMEGRMTICNMSIEAGARAGMIAPDEKTFEYLKGRDHAPQDSLWAQAVAYWETLPSDEGAQFDKVLNIKAEDIKPQVTWGTSPGQVVSVEDCVPDPESFTDPVKKTGAQDALKYMDLKPGTPINAIKIDKVFLGSCTNGRIEDLRSAAEIVKGQKVNPEVQAIVVPGSGRVRRQAEKEGLDKIFTDAGFEWRFAGCSMCLGMNDDQLSPGERCASSSNRNFEGRQGPGGRTHLMSPQMVVAAAIEGEIVDVRKFCNR